MWKEVVMAQFRILFQHLLEENAAHDNLLAKICILNL
jgi:hypothetical protein